VRNSQKLLFRILLL